MLRQNGGASMGVKYSVIAFIVGLFCLFVFGMAGDIKFGDTENSHNRAVERSQTCTVNAPVFRKTAQKVFSEIERQEGVIWVQNNWYLLPFREKEALSQFAANCLVDNELAIVIRDRQSGKTLATNGLTGLKISE